MRVLFITNVLTPYRIYFFDELSEQITKLGGSIKVLVMLAPDHNLYWKYEDYQREYTELLPVKYLKDKSDYFINFHVKSKILEFDPNYVIGCGAYWYPTIIYAQYVCRTHKIKMLYWSESNKIRLFDKSGISYRVREALRKNIYRKMNGFIYPGKYALELIHDYNQDAKFWFELPNLIDYRDYTRVKFEKEQIRKELGIGKELSLFCPARLSYEKGVIPFLKLFSETELKKYSTVYIAGKGPEEEKTKEVIESYKLKVVLLGYVNQATMIKYYNACDVFVLPSLSDASPLTCVEALWCGIPLVLSSAIGNAPEVLIEGKNGFQFDYGNKEQAIKILNNIMTLDSEWFSRAREISIQIAEKNFKTEDIIEQFINKLYVNQDG